MRRLTTVTLLNSRTVALLFGSIALASIGVTSASAQMTDADVYEHIIKPQEEKRAGEIADIMARPSNWHPGEIRSNGNYGGIAWYQKGGGDYGYIVTRGYISPTSASVQMTMECEALKVTCEGGGMLTNQWLVIGKRTDTNRYVTASAQNRKEAEALVLEQCQKEGGSCIIQDTFDIMPHKRGITYMRPRVKHR